MVPPVIGIRHLRPLASPSTSASTPASRPVSTSHPLAKADDAAQVQAQALAIAHTAIATTTAAIPQTYRHIGHPLRYGFSIRPFLPVPSPHRPLQTRGKKTTTTFQLSDLPQGLIQPKPVSPLPTSSKASSPHDETTEPMPLPLPLPSLPQDPPAYPTVVLQARQNMLKFDNCVLLTRVGGFYELYFEHAEEYGPLLNIKVASKKTNAGLVSMVSSLLPAVLSLSWLDISPSSSVL